MPLIVERMSGVRSAALCWLLPVGNASDPEGAAGDGDSVLLAELVLRGAGGRSSREFSDTLDRLGVQRSVSAGAMHLQIAATMLGSRVEDALPRIVELVRDPALPEEHLDAVRSLALQSLDSLADDPQQRVVLRLRERQLPPPFNRTGLGDRAALEGATIERLRARWAERAVPGGAILALAGDVDPDRVAPLLERLLAGWSGVASEPTEERPALGGIAHEMSESAQTHIAIGFRAPPEGDPGATLFRLATRILGGDSSSRLFSEVREKRGLCYSIGATYSGGRDRGMLSIYAGSTPERAQATVDCIDREVRRFAEGIEPDEFARAAVGYCSRLVMSGESTAGRAAAAAGDWYRLGRVRSLGELKAEVDAITPERLTRYVAEAFGPAWIGTRCAYTIGPAPVHFA
jgi:predicted Zn-dependent peptidase